MGRHGTILLACAWVLWQQSMTIGPPVKVGDVLAVEAGPMFPISAHSSKSECEQETRSQMEAGIRSGRTQLGSRGVLLGGGMSITFRCLPDTVDPRAKK